MALNARGWIVLVAAVATAAVTARLGVWQLSRAAQKEALQAALDERMRLPPLGTAELARTDTEAAAQHHRAVAVEGRWVAGHTVYLDNRQMNGRPGFFVVTPLLLADGTAVVVQRGWLPRDPVDRTRVVEPPTPGQDVRLVGRIAPPPGRLYEFDGAQQGAIRQNLDMSAYGLQVGRPLRPLSVVQEDGPGAKSAADGLSRQWSRPAADIHKHHGYAFQWFALSALVIGLYVWFQLVRPRRLA